MDERLYEVVISVLRKIVKHNRPMCNLMFRTVAVWAGSVRWSVMLDIDVWMDR